MSTSSQSSQVPVIKRLASLDFMRGMIMVLLALEAAELYTHLKAATIPETFLGRVIHQFFHNNWEGLHFWDLIQPSFMLMAGVAMTYSLTAQINKGISWNERFMKIFKRFGWLMFWGIFKRICGENWLHLNSLDVTDILTQLAFTTLIAFFLFDLSIRQLILVCIGILGITELLYRCFHIPGFIEGYTQGKNFGAYIDYLLLGQQGNSYVFINWLPTSVHTISGVIIGKLLMTAKKPIYPILISAGVCLVVGYGLDFLAITPIIKPIATSSFMLASTGYVLLILSILYWWIDMMNHKRGLLFFQVVGMNSIFIYLFNDIIGRGWLNKFGELILSPLKFNLGFNDTLYLIISSLSVFMFEWWICWFLYKKNIFFKL